MVTAALALGSTLIGATALWVAARRVEVARDVVRRAARPVPAEGSAAGETTRLHDATGVLGRAVDRHVGR